MSSSLAVSKSKNVSPTSSRSTSCAAPHDSTGTSNVSGPNVSALSAVTPASVRTNGAQSAAVTARVPGGADETASQRPRDGSYRLARFSPAIFSCSVRMPCSNASGRGGQPGT